MVDVTVTRFMAHRVRWNGTHGRHGSCQSCPRQSLLGRRTGHLETRALSELQRADAARRQLLALSRTPLPDGTRAKVVVNHPENQRSHRRQ